MAETELKTYPWTLGVYERAKIAPVWIGVMIGSLYLLVSSAMALVSGNFYGVPLEGRALWEVTGWWTDLVNAVMLGFGPTAMAYSRRGAARDVRDLSPILSPGIETHIENATRLDQKRLRWTGAFSAFGALFFVWLDPGLTTTRANLAWNDPSMLLLVGRHSLLAWLWTRSIAADVMTAGAFAKLADQLREVDLLDLRPLLPFARRGMRSLLTWMTASAIFSLFWLGPSAGESNLVWLVVMASVAAAAVARPLRGVHRRIRSEKDASLAEIRGAIRMHQAAMLSESADTAAAADRLPALYAAEARVASVREWPFDAGTLLRFAFYVTLGLGSWLGGALVERLLGVFLD